MRDPFEKAQQSSLLGEWPAPIQKIQEHLLQWYAKNGRQNLPWTEQSAYGVWISEIMLQQTQVVTVIPKFQAWMQQFPTLKALAEADEEQVLKAWEGLGYYARARSIHTTAKKIMQEHGGQFPSSREHRLALPGIGPSTASAIGAFVWQHREPIMDANVQRWLKRVCASPSMTENEAWQRAIALMPEKPEQISVWAQASMDLGALICTAKRPQCQKCPFQTWCKSAFQTTNEEKPKKALKKEWRVHWVWISNHQGQWALWKKTKGPWKSLWMPPLLEHSKRDPLVTGKHTLSHRNIVWTMERGSLDDVSTTDSQHNIEWKSLAEIETLALPTPLKKWWDEQGKVWLMQQKIQ